MGTYTPGPWTVGGNNINVEGHVFAGSRLIANCQAHQDGREGTRQTNNANAHLIALAPEMAALLDEISVPKAFPEWDAARRALLARLEL